MNARARLAAFRDLGLGLCLGFASLANAAEPEPEKLERLNRLAAEFLPAETLATLAQQQWFPSSPGCRFRLADPPSGFTQFFVSTNAEGLSEVECGGNRTIGIYKKGQLLGPAANLDIKSGTVYGGMSWPGGVLTGAGISLKPDGLRFEGSLSGGRFNGSVTIRRPDGKYSQGTMVNDQYAPGEFRSYSGEGRLLERVTIGLDGRPTAVKEYEGESLKLEAPVVGEVKQGFGHVYEPGAQSELQRRATLWDKDSIKYQSPTLAEIMVSPCPPLLSALGVFRPTPESCSEAVIAARAAAELAMTPVPVPSAPTGDPLLATTPPATAAAASVAASAVVPELAPAAPPPPLEIKEYPFVAYSEDGRNYVRGITRNGELVPAEIGFEGGTRRYQSKGMDAQLNGPARYFQNEELVFDGRILDGQFDGEGLCRFNGSLERCEYAYGERVDQLFKTRLELQAYKSAKQQEQERIAREHQQKLAAERQRLAQAQAAQQAAAQQQQNSGFQWGKLAALGTGALIGGLTKLPTEMQADIITGFVSDSMAGQEGISNTQTAMQAYANTGSGGDSLAGGAAAQAPKQSLNYRANCPGTGREINIPITYRTQACLVAAQEFALAYACNDADSFATVTQGCVAACGSSQCAEQ